MNNHNIILNYLKICIWPFTALILAFFLFCVFFPFSGILLIEFFEIGNLINFFILLVTFFAFMQATEAGFFDKEPKVVASGTFVTSTNSDVNSKRDLVIKKIQSLQLINIGRGYAMSVVPSKSENTEGELLEDLCPHEFNLPPETSTNTLGEILRINGGNFNGNKFFIHYKDKDGEKHITQVNVSKIQYTSLENERNCELDSSDKNEFKNGKLVFWKIKSNEHLSS